jgi:biopolymer transport protein ExbD
MNFHRQRPDEPEINLIPFIDVLLVILIFLMLSTTYSRFTELQVALPTADAAKMPERTDEVIVAVSADGRYSVRGQAVDGRSVERLADALSSAAKGRSDAMVVVSADALAPHQTVINVLDAARRAGLVHLTFAAQAPAGAAR